MPSTTQISTQFQHLIWYNLDNLQLKAALFYAERLHANDPKSHDNSYLLALCHLRNGNYQSAYTHSRLGGARGAHLACAYVFAQACLALGQSKCHEGISALERSKAQWVTRESWNRHSDTERQVLPDAAAAWCLLGKLYREDDNLNRASVAFNEALNANPLSWDAMAILCELGANVKVQSVYKMTPEMIAFASRNKENEPDHQQISRNNSFAIQSAAERDPFNTSIKPRGLGLGKVPLFEKLNVGGHASSKSAVVNVPFDLQDTPTGPASGRVKAETGFGGESSRLEPPKAPIRRTKPLGEHNIAEPTESMRARIGSRSTSRQAGEIDDSRPQSRTISHSNVTAAPERKRTVSGHITNARPEPQQSTADSSTNSNVQGLQRRSVRLFNQIRPDRTRTITAATAVSAIKDLRDSKKAKPAITKPVRSHATVGRVISGNRKHPDAMDIEPRPPSTTSTNHPSSSATISKPLSEPIKPVINSRTRELEALDWILKLMSTVSHGYQALHHYRNIDAIEFFKELPAQQRDTPWILAQIGTAYYEEAQWKEAEKYFLMLRRLAPEGIEHMEVFSSVLWHLKNEIDLACLAHELLQKHPLAPQSWCAAGNAASLDKKHEEAITCFERARQLDPGFAYAYSLEGHEHVSNEEFDKAIDAFRAAIAADARHYNAWYGLGRVYEKQGRYDLADKHYRNAMALNSNNAVLLCCRGIVLEKIRNPRLALDQYNKACQVQPKLHVARFRKARLLLQMDELHLALTELQILRDLCPEEANVHFLLGGVYKQLNQKGPAIRHFTAALNLDPKGAHFVKEAMDQLEEREDEDMS